MKTETMTIPTELRGNALPAIKTRLADGIFGGVITLRDGRHVAVVYLDWAKPPKRQSADAQREWVKGIDGAQLITPAIGALLVATLGKLLPQEWVWTSDDFEHDTAYAWYCGLNGGYVGDTIRSASGGAVAVRLIPLVL